jgi:hypothetical protein
VRGGGPSGGSYSGRMDEEWERQRRRSGLIGGTIALAGLTVAILIAVIWGSPFGKLSLGPGRGWAIAETVGLVLAALVVLLPLAIVWGSRAVPTPPSIRLLDLSRFFDLLGVTLPTSALHDGQSSVRSVTGLVTADWANWGPVATVECFDWGFSIRPSRWPVIGKRWVPRLDVDWRTLRSVRTLPSHRGADLLVVEFGKPRWTFGLWLGPLGAVKLLAPFQRRIGDGSEP